MGLADFRKQFSRMRSPISGDRLRTALDVAIGEPPAMMLVHSSLSACGQFTAGPEDVVGALRERTANLCLPTHTYCYPAALGDTAPVFDPTSTPSKNGVLTEVFRKRPDVKRSINPTHSMAVSGPLSDAMIEGHELLDAPCGAGSPWARLVEKNAAALMFGVSFHAYTPYHTAEDAAESQWAYEPGGRIDRLRYLGPDGVVHERQCRRQSWTPRRFREAGDLLERVGLVRRVALGRGHLLYVPETAKVHDFLVERLRKTPDFLYLNCPAPLQ